MLGYGGLVVVVFLLGFDVIVERGFVFVMGMFIV